MLPRPGSADNAGSAGSAVIDNAAAMGDHQRSRHSRPADPMNASLFARFVLGAVVAGAISLAPDALAAQAEPAADAATARALLDRYCVTCHNGRLRTAGLELDAADPAAVARDGRIWEQVARKLRIGAMPPPGRPRPAHGDALALAAYLETALDQAAAGSPRVGRTETFHRLNRAEYRNAVRDLLQVDADVSELLPADDADAHGFDNMAAVLSVSPALLERYLSAARRISRLAVGFAPPAPSVDTHHVPLLLYQDERLSEHLPFGSRGGVAIAHRFPVDGEYSVRLRLQRTYTDYIRGLGTPQHLDVRLDGRLLKRFTVGGGAPPHASAAPASFAGNTPLFGHPEWEAYVLGADEDLEVTFSAAAGQRLVGVSFERRLWEPEGVLQPRQNGLPARHQRALAGQRRDRQRRDRRAVHRGRAGRHRQPARRLHVSSGGGRRRRGLRADDPGEAGAARLPAAGHGPRPRRAARILRAAAGGRLRSRHPVRAAAVAQRPGVPVPDRARPRRRGAGERLSGERSHPGLTAVVLPVEQHSGRGAAGRSHPRGSRRSRPAGGPGAPHAARPAVARARGQLRRPVAAAAQHPDRPARPDPVPDVRREPADRVPARVGAVRREHHARRPQRGRPDCRRLHVRRRAAGRALRHPRRLRQPLPQGDARRAAGRPAGTRRPAHRHVVSESEPHVAGAAREVGAGEPAGRAAAAAAARRALVPGARGRRRAGHRARAAGDAPAQPGVRRMPRADGPPRVRAGSSSTRSAAGGHTDAQAPIDARGRDAHRRRLRRPVRVEGDAGQQSRAAGADRDREAAGVCARPRHRIP